MAKKIAKSTNKAKATNYNSGSKMRGYNQIFDDDIQQMRTGLRNDDLDTSNLNDSDILWTVTPGFEYRIDLISNKFYGTAKYDWIIEQINDIKDPIKDLEIGVKLSLPTQSRILTLT